LFEEFESIFVVYAVVYAYNLVYYNLFFLEKAMHAQENLIRKQFLVSRSQVTKLEKIANAKGTSAAEVVRLAIDAFDPDAATDAMNSDDLMNLVHSQLKEAITATGEANEAVANALEQLNKEH
jgi:hypothetical protein